MSRIWGHEERPGWFASISRVLALSAVVGIGIWTYLNAKVWTPLQRYYWNEYLNTEMYRVAQGEYWILNTVDHRGQRHLATESEVVPAARHGRELVPFSLSTQAQQAGATDLVVDTVHYSSEQMHQKLAQSIYHDQSVTELALPAWGGGVCVLILGIGWAIRRNFVPRDLINDGRRLKGPQIVAVKEFNRWSRADGIGFMTANRGEMLRKARDTGTRERKGPISRDRPRRFFMITYTYYYTFSQNAEMNLNINNHLLADAADLKENLSALPGKV